MIAELYEKIAEGLKAVKQCEVWQEDVPQNMSQPSFLMSIYDQTPSNGINKRKKNEVGVDVMYFPESEQDADAISECWRMGEQLNISFSIPNFKMKNRNLSVTDKVLHYTFTVPYRTIIDHQNNKMQEISRSTIIKEE